MLQTKENFQKARVSGYIRHNSITEGINTVTASAERIESKRQTWDHQASKEHLEQLKSQI
jgi:hypothetical protein